MSEPWEIPTFEEIAAMRLGSQRISMTDDHLIVVAREILALRDLLDHVYEMGHDCEIEFRERLDSLDRRTS